MMKFSIFSLACSFLIARAADSCPADAMSCTSKTGDECCTPSNGLIVLAEKWGKELGPEDAFTVNWFWPSACSGMVKEWCDPAREYPHVESILKKNRKVYNEAHRYWPSIAKIPNPFDVLWTQEWGKHGTCLSTVAPKCYSDYQQYQDVYEYFDTALGLRLKYDLFRILSDAGVTPNSTYPVTKFETAIESAIGVKPVITCSGTELDEIWIYFHVKHRDQYVPTARPQQLPAGVDKNLCHGMINYPEKYIK